MYQAHLFESEYKHKVENFMIYRRHTYSPEYHDDGKKNTWPQLLEQNVRKGLKKRVGNEEHC
jgi:hypothetical protein